MHLTFASLVVLSHVLSSTCIQLTLSDAKLLLMIMLGSRGFDVRDQTVNVFTHFKSSMYDISGKENDCYRLISAQ